MGKATRWFRALLGLKKEEPPPDVTKPPRRRWSFAKSRREKKHIITKNATTTKERRGYLQGNVPPATPGRACGDVDPNDHAIAVATAAASVAEAAIEAAQAAAAALRMTSGGRCNAATGSSPAYVSGASCGIREERGAVKIQAHFRGYLARRALRALKGLVKLQALVRGHIVRKQTSEMLRIAQALLRAQARARAGRTHIYESPHTSTNYSQFLQHGPATPEILEHAMRSISAKHDQSLMLKRHSSKSIGRVIIDQDKAQNNWNRLDHRVVDEGSCYQRGPSMKMGQTEDENSNEILDVYTGRKPHCTPKRKIIFQSSHHALASDHYGHTLCTSKDSSTHQTVLSSSICEVRSLSPLKFRQSDDGSSSYLSGCSDHPSYMACTESSRAKMRSLSAPKQRPQFERSVSLTKGNLVHSNGDSRSSTQRISASFVNKAYPGSGCLDSLGMPMGGNAAGLNASYSHRS